MKNRNLLGTVLPIITIFCGSASFAGDGPELRRYEFRDAHMGTQFRIVLYTADEPAANAASRAAFQRIAELDGKLSDYRADSELMRLCFQAGGPPVQVSDELFSVLSHAQALTKRSDGAF